MTQKTSKLWMTGLLAGTLLIGCRPIGQSPEEVTSLKNNGVGGRFGACKFADIKSKSAREKARMALFLYNQALKGNVMAKLLLDIALIAKEGPVEGLERLAKENPNLFTASGEIHPEAIKKFNDGNLEIKIPKAYTDSRSGERIVELSTFSEQTTSEHYKRGMRDILKAEYVENRNQNGPEQAEKHLIDQLKSIAEIAELSGSERSAHAREMIADILLNTSSGRGAESFYDKAALEISRSHYEGLRKAAISSANGYTGSQTPTGERLIKIIEAMKVAHEARSTERSFNELEKESTRGGSEKVATSEYVVREAGNRRGLQELEAILTRLKRQGPTARLTEREVTILNSRDLALKEGGRMAEVFRATKARERQRSR